MRRVLISFLRFWNSVSRTANVSANLDHGYDLPTRRSSGSFAGIHFENGRFER